MEFASDYVYDNVKESEYDMYEYVSDEEYEGGMNISGSSSDSSSDEDIEALVAKGDPVPQVSQVPPVPPLPAKTYRKHLALKQKKKKHHWKMPAKTESDTRYVNPTYDMNATPLADPPPTACQTFHRSKKFRRADTNIVSVKLQQLVAPSNMHAGDPIHCSKCDAVLSLISKIVKDGPDKVWECEFCKERNLIDIEDEEIPKNDDVTFLLEPALSTAASGTSGRDESLVVFCVDISGSMCVTTEVPGKLKLRGSSHLERLQSFNEDRSDQYLPRQHRNVTYVSRLQAVQAAVDHQLEEMSSKHPHRRVALITFDNEVSVIGDGTGTPTSIVGDKLSNQEALAKMGAAIDMPKSIRETRKSLGEKLFNLQEGGGTALGPSLIVAISVASKHPGSKIIICTDGMANVGLGRLDEFESEQKQEEQESFYVTVAKLAVSKGVSMSVITIKGTNCKLLHLGKLADTTGGQVNIVDSMKLTEEFSNILASQIVATNVVATFILHKQMYFFNKANPDSKESKVIRDVGNCTTETEITFEYAVKRPDAKKKKTPPTIPEDMETDETAHTRTEGTATDAVPESSESTTDDPSTGDAKTDTATSHTSADAGQSKEQEEATKSCTPSELPFQLQVCYTDTDGVKALRVLTQVKPVTVDRNVAEQNVNLDVLGLHTAQHSAQLALEGEYTLSRGTALMNQRLAWRAAQTPQKKTWYRRIFSKIRSVENTVTTAQQAERSNSCHGTTYSDDEDEDIPQEDYECCNTDLLAPAPKMRMGKLKARSSEVNDSMAGELYNFHKISSDTLKK